MSQAAVLSNIAALRANTSNSASAIIVQGYTNIDDGGGGTYIYVPADTTSSDNGGTIIVDASGNRWYLYFSPATTTVSVLQFGADPTGAVDSTAAIQHAINTGLNVYLPRPSNYYWISGYLKISTASQVVFGDGPGSTIEFVPSASTQIQPAIIVMQTAQSCVLRDFAINHNGPSFGITVGFETGLGTGAGDARGCGVLVMADKTRVDGIFVLNGWDDGLGFGNFALFTTGDESAGPDQAVAVACQTYNCGSGRHDWSPAPGGYYNQGAGIDFLTATNFECSHCKDFGSYDGFWADATGGAYGSFVNCCSENCQYSAVWSSSINNSAITFQPTGSTGWLATPGGLAFYSGSYGVQFVNCIAINPGLYGMVLDTSSSSNQVTNFRCVGAGLNGLIDAGANNNFCNIDLEGCGSATGTTAPSGAVAPSAAAISFRGSPAWDSITQCTCIDLNVVASPTYPGNAGSIKYSYAAECVGLGSDYKAVRLIASNLVAGTSGTMNVGPSCFVAEIARNSNASDFWFNDNQIGYFNASGLTVNKSIGVNGTSPPTQMTGFGTPTGGTVIGNFPGGTATLAQTSETVAEILMILKAYGMVGS